jgi:hypothetical protein
VQGLAEFCKFVFSTGPLLQPQPLKFTHSKTPTPNSNSPHQVVLTYTRKLPCSFQQRQILLSTSCALLPHQQQQPNHNPNQQHTKQHQVFFEVVLRGSATTTQIEKQKTLLTGFGMGSDVSAWRSPCSSTKKHSFCQTVTANSPFPPVSNV